MTKPSSKKPAQKRLTAADHVAADFIHRRITTHLARALGALDAYIPNRLGALSPAEVTNLAGVRALVEKARKQLPET